MGRQYKVNIRALWKYGTVSVCVCERERERERERESARARAFACPGGGMSALSPLVMFLFPAEPERCRAKFGSVRV